MNILHSKLSTQWTLANILGSAEPEIQRTCNLLIQTVVPPHGLPALATVVTGATRCILAAHDSIPTPNAELTSLVQGIQGLEKLLRAELSTAARTSAVSELHGTRTRYSEWCLMADTGHSRAHLLADTFAGLYLLTSIGRSKLLKPSQVKRVLALRKEEDISADHLAIFLRGETPDHFLGQRWALDLIRVWRAVVSEYSENPEPPKPTTRERLASQILSASMHGSTQVRAGALSHRQLSPRQFRDATTSIWRAVQEDTLAGALGAISIVSTFSVDLIAALPLLGSGLDPDWDATIDTEGGFLQVDYQCVAPEASQPLPGCTPSSFLCVRPLPQLLAKNLRERQRRYPQAKTLKELYPSDPEPVPDSAIYRSSAGMQPTWPRLRTSTSHFLRRGAIDSFVVSTVSGDFTIVPRSKLYYASLSATEIAHGFTLLYADLGWGAPVPPKSQLNFGCQVVPLESAIKALDRYLIEKLQESAPGRHTSAARLMEFNNNYMRLLGARASLLLALRETKELSIPANFDETADQWLPVHDKIVPNDFGYMPVPICDFLRDTIQAHRKHCFAMHSRLKALDLADSDLARWCLLVARKSKVPLLCIAPDLNALRPLATNDFMSFAGGDSVLPPDFGRKAMENLLRGEGMRSSDIDSILRHALKGQGHTSVTADFSPGCMHRRFETAMKNITARLYGNVVHGLSKE